MSDDLSTKVVTVVDNGLFVDIALRIAPAFKKVYFWSPWQSAFPRSSTVLVGDGFDEIDRTRWLFDAIEKSDLIVFPDVYWQDLQVFLEKTGKLVWGSRKGEVLELNRAKTKELLKSLDLPVGPYEVVRGMRALRSYLLDHPNSWVKLSINRGDAETFNSLTYDIIKPRLDQLEAQLGGKSELAEFVVEDNLESEIEVGYDGFCIDGNFPKRSFMGYELKDEFFIGSVKDYKELPEFIRESNDKLAPFFARHKYRGFYSSELRVTKDKTAYLIDPCCRGASPPHEIYLEIFDNWPEIFWYGAQGKLIDPNPVFKYGICAMMHSTFATKNWLPLHIPDDIRHLVKIRNWCRIDGVDYFVPQPDSELPEIGALVAVSDSLEDAIEQLKENAERIQAYSLEIKIDGLDKGMEQVEAGKALGIEL